MITCLSHVLYLIRCCGLWEKCRKNTPSSQEKFQLTIWGTQGPIKLRSKHDHHQLKPALRNSLVRET